MIQAFKIVFTQPSIEPTKTSTGSSQSTGTAEINMGRGYHPNHLVEVVLTKPKLVKEDFQVSTSV
jgi:hypothetical protein